MFTVCFIINVNYQTSSQILKEKIIDSVNKLLVSEMYFYLNSQKFLQFKKKFIYYILLIVNSYCSSAPIQI